MVSLIWVLSQNSYWTGSAWGSPGQVYFRPVNGTTTWTYPKGPDTITNAFINGATYQIAPWEIDGAGNASTGTITTFVYDNVAPTSTITLPLNSVYYRNLPNISGTAFDDTSGVNITGIYIYDNTLGEYYGWTGSAWDFSASIGENNKWLVTQGTPTNWQYSGYASKMQDGHSYTIVSKSTDNAFPQNVETVYSVGKNTVTFVYDIDFPTATVTLPNVQFASIVPLISGTANDTLSGIGSVQIAIQDIGQGTTWYNGAGGWVSQGTQYWIQATTAAGNPPTWSYDATSVPWAEPKQYTIYARAKDNAVDATIANNPNVQVILSSTSVMFDVEAPTVAVTYPNYGGSNLINFIPVITGTAYDWPAGVANQNVFVAILETNHGECWWNPASSTFNYKGASPVYSTATVSGSGPTYTWSWQCPPLQNGYQYMVQAIATDRAGNQENPATIIPANRLYFTYENTAPMAGITLPNRAWENSLPTISGTASDPYGIASVKVAYEQNPPGGLWWDGNSGFTSNSPQFFTAQGTTLWTHSQSNSPNSPTWVNNTQYLVRAFAYNVALTSSAYTEATFSYDNITPTSTVTYPAQGSYLSSIARISGNQYDTYSGVQNVNLRLQEKNVGSGTVLRSWYGSQGWQNTNVSSWVVVDALYQSTWSYTTAVASLTFTSGNRYDATSLAWNVAGSSEAASDVPAFDTWFIYDNTNPDSRVSVPSNSLYYSNLTNITGTAEDNPPEPSGAGVAQEALAIEDLSVAGPNNWWNGAGAFTAPPASMWQVATGSTSWAYSFVNTNFTDGHRYLMLSQATDKSYPAMVENTYTVGVNSVTFVCDKSSPTSTVAYPPNGLITNTVPVISGTSVDPLVSGNASGIQMTQIAIQNNTSGLWWNGAGFTQSQSTPNFITVSYQLTPANTYWNYTNAGLVNALATQTTYTIFSCAYDNAYNNASLIGNYQTNYSSTSFVYTITNPTSNIVGISAAMNALSTISGTAVDNFGISNVGVLIQDVTQGTTYWNGTSWQNTVPVSWPKSTLGNRVLDIRFNTQLGRCPSILSLVAGQRYCRQR